MLLVHSSVSQGQREIGGGGGERILLESDQGGRERLREREREAL